MRERLRLLLDHRGLELGVERVVRADLRAEPVLERRDDATAVRVVLGVGRRQQHDVDGEPDLVAADLHVALLEHVEQTHLDALGEVGKLVDREDAAVGARDEPVVDGELVGEIAALGHLDGVDLTDQVGDRGVGSGELLTEAAVAVDPLDRRLVAALGHEQPRVLRDRVVRVVVDLAAGDDRHPLVEQLGEPADHAGLGLPALAEEDHVVAGDQRVLELREDGVLVADHAVDELLALGDPRDRVGAHLFFDGPRNPAAGPELAEGSGTRHRATPSRGVVARHRISGPADGDRRTAPNCAARNHFHNPTCRDIGS